MSMITEQVRELKEYADNRKGEIARICREAADTIETLSAKNHAYAMERSTAYYIVNSADFPEDKIHQLDLVLKGEIPKEYDILAYKKAFEDIRAEIASQEINKDKRFIEEIWWNSALQKCLEIIDKHNPDKAGKERE